MNFNSFYRDHVKRALDIAGSSVALVASAPVMGLCAIAIKLDDGGKVLFAQKRAGLHGRVFTIYKFRSMKEGDVSAATGYPTASAVTRVGRLLRRANLDELPQLWNILIGEMSFVGPRPALTDQTARYKGQQSERLNVRPGLTGLAQIRYRNRAPLSVRILADLEYVEQLSLLTDCHILFRTIPAVLAGAGQVTGQTVDQVDDLGAKDKAP